MYFIVFCLDYSMKWIVFLELCSCIGVSGVNWRFFIWFYFWVVNLEKFLNDDVGELDLEFKLLGIELIILLCIVVCYWDICSDEYFCDELR